MALAIDSSSPGITIGVGASGVTTLTSASFSPPANSLIFVGTSNFFSDGLVSGITDNLGSPLTYHNWAQKSSGSGGGTAECWWAWCANSQTNMTVTPTWAGGSPGGPYAADNLIVSIIVFTGAASSQSGTTATGSGSGNPTATLASAASTSWVMAHITNDSNNTAPTIPGGQTDSFNSHTYFAGTSGQGSGWTQGNNAVGNSNKTINDTAPSVTYAEVVVEVQQAAAAALPNPQVLSWPQAAWRSAYRMQARRRRPVRPKLWVPPRPSFGGVYL